MNLVKVLKKAWFSRTTCERGIHRRSGRHARFDGQIWISKCKYCGVPIYRNMRREWVNLDENAD